MTEQTAFSLAASAIGFVSAIFFCIGNASNSVKKITLLSTSFWDFSEPVARALTAQRAQYVTGGLLLLFAFGLQVLATLASSTTPVSLPQCLHTGPYLVLSVLAPTALLSWWGCWALDRKTIDKVLSRHREQLAEEQQKLEAKTSVPSTHP